MTLITLDDAFDLFLDGSIDGIHFSANLTFAQYVDHLKHVGFRVW